MPKFDAVISVGRKEYPVVVHLEQIGPLGGWFRSPGPDLALSDFGPVVKLTLDSIEHSIRCTAINDGIVHFVGRDPKPRE